MSECDILILPGLGGGSPDHWYARWASRMPTARRVEQRDFDRPVCSEWVDRIAAASGNARRPVILAGHSLGAIAAVHAAPRLEGVAGAFLVAPGDEHVMREIAEIGRDFLPVPRQKLPFPSMLIASRNDPYAPYESSAAYASAWHSTLVDAGDAGHINADSGHGPWPEGMLRFGAFLTKL